jgi:hypothetical protein
MMFNAFQRDDDDAVYTIVRNVSGGALVLGDSVVWDVSSSVDGVRVTTPATATLSLFRGVLGEALADSAYGKCQVHGLSTYARVTNDLTTPIAAGDILVPANAVTTLERSAASDGTTGFVYAAEAVATDATPAAAAKKVLIRAL